MRVAFIYHFDDQSWVGGRNYFGSLFAAMHRYAPAIELLLVVGARTRTTLPDEHPYVRVIRTSMLDRRRPLWFFRQMLRLFTARRYDPALGALLARMGVDVLSHSPPWKSPGSDISAITWIPDFQFVHLPHLWSEKELARIQTTYVAMLRDSDRVILSSEDAHRDLRSFAPWYDKPVHVLHFAPQHVPVEGASITGEVLQRYGVSGPYAFLPNQFWVHKNHAVVIDALRVLEAHGEPVTVLCTGQPRDPRQPRYFGELIARAKEYGLEQRFRVLGLVPYADMRALMREAHVLINPSRFEGWSTTVEEGKLMGKRMVLSDIAVHREQAPPFATYFDKDSPEDLARALIEAMREPVLEIDPAILEQRSELRTERFASTYARLLGDVAGVPG